MPDWLKVLIAVPGIPAILFAPVLLAEATRLVWR